MTPAHQELLSELTEFARTAPTAEAVMARIAQRLRARFKKDNIKL